MQTEWPAMELRGPTVREADIAAFERVIGHPLPDDYRAFLLEVNGGRLAIENTQHPMFVVNTLFRLGADDESFDLQRQTTEAREVPADMLFVGYDDGGNRLLVALASEHRGEVWFQHRRTRRDMQKLAESWREFLAGLGPLLE